MPLAYFGRPVIVPVQSLSSLSVTDWPSESVTVSVSGRLPSWFSLSFQTFFTVASVCSGVCELVSVVTRPSPLTSVLVSV